MKPAFPVGDAMHANCGAGDLPRQESSTRSPMPRNKILIGLRISQPADFEHVVGVRPMIWLPRRRRSVRFLLARVSIVLASGLAVQMAAAGNGGPIPLGSQSLVLPDFAKNVQVRVDGKLVSLDKAV